MTNRISSPCVIIPSIILGIIFLITPSSYAQNVRTWEIERGMKVYPLLLKMCKESESRVANVKNREALDKLYQNYLQKHNLAKKPRADYEKAKSEEQKAWDAFNVAHDKFISMADKCERAKSMNPKADPRNIQDCIDAKSFHEKVVTPRNNTANARSAVCEEKKKILSAHEDASFSAWSAYQTELWKNIEVPYYLLNWDEYRKIEDAPPDQLRDVVKGVCSRYNSEMQKLIKQVISKTDAYIKACKPGDADTFVRSLPEFPEKKKLQQGIHDARRREEVAQVNYEEGRSLYRQGRTEEMKGNVAQAQDLYRRAIAKMQEGRKSTKCDSRLKQFDKAIGQINSRLAQKGTTNIGNCDVPKDFTAQKRALHARIKKGNTFREDGGGQWNPTFVMRAGYSVGSEQLKATALALNAMSNLVGGYEQCYAKFWSFMEGELVQLTKARDAAYKKSWAEGQRINGILGKKKAEAASALNTCIIDSDNTFKAAMKKAQELCK